jgi:hypothetical protein
MPRFRLRNGMLALGAITDRESNKTLVATKAVKMILDLDLAIIGDAYDHTSRLQRTERERSDAVPRFDQAAGCMIAILRAGEIAYFNSFAEQLTGFTADELLN